MHYWIQFGQSDSWLRLPSAVAGVLAVVCLWRVGAGALNQSRLGLLAAAFLALSPIHIWYAREARMYGPAGLAWVASLYFYIRVLHRGRWTDSIGLAVATLAGIYLTYSTLGLLFLEAAAVLIVWRLGGGGLQRLLRWCAAQALILLGIAAWWPVLQRQLQVDQVFHWQLPAELSDQGLALTLSETLRLALPAGLILLVLFLAASYLLLKWQGLRSFLRRLTTPAAVGVLAAFVVLAAIGAIPRGLSIRRQLLVFWPLLTLAGAWAVWTLRRPWLAASLAVVLFALSLTVVFGRPYEDWRGIADVVARQAAPGDQVLVYPTYYHGVFSRYYAGSAPHAGLDADRLLRGRLPMPANDVWLILPYPALSDLTPDITRQLEQDRDNVANNVFGRIEVRHFAKP